MTSSTIFKDGGIWQIVEKTFDSDWTWMEIWLVDWLVFYANFSNISAISWRGWRFG